MFTQRLTGSRWSDIPEEYIERLVQGRVRAIQKGKLEERRHEVRDHEHGQAGVSKGKKEAKLDDEMSYCYYMAAANSGRRFLGARGR